MLYSGMRIVLERAVLTVARHEGMWRVEYEGDVFGRSRDREITMAAASRRAREMQDAGRPCQVQVRGEPCWRAA